MDKIRLRTRSPAFLKVFIRRKIYRVHIIILIKYSLHGRDVLTYIVLTWPSENEGQIITYILQGIKLMFRVKHFAWYHIADKLHSCGLSFRWSAALALSTRAHNWELNCSNVRVARDLLVFDASIGFA